MRIVGVDRRGNQRCWKCGGQEFVPVRATREKTVLGIHATVTRPMLRCEYCGEYSDLGGAAESA